MVNTQSIEWISIRDGFPETDSVTGYSDQVLVAHVEHGELKTSAGQFYEDEFSAEWVSRDINLYGVFVWAAMPIYGGAE